MQERLQIRGRDLNGLKISNPKRHLDPIEAQEARLFPYYAGFSMLFAEQSLRTLGLQEGAIVFDPWNGSGTTTDAAGKCGLAAIGVDRNPAMVVVAKARHVSPLDVSSLVPLSHAILERADVDAGLYIEGEPLAEWLAPHAAASVRAIEAEIHRALVSHDTYRSLTSSESLATITPLAAFFYVALFRTTRRFLSDFIPSNPTWTKSPETPANRKRPTPEAIKRLFLGEVHGLALRIQDGQTLFSEEAGAVSIRLANAEQLPLAASSIDAVLTSPPYCTRIDYAVATSIELALLRLDEEEFDSLRRTLTGTLTVERDQIEADVNWGAKCMGFLNDVYNHESKASKTYYYKNHTQYFRSLYNSLGELSRVLQTKSPCIFVVQDSYYKEIRNDIAGIISEMAENQGLWLKRQEDFSASRSMVGVNSRARKYLDKRSTIESVLCFERM